MSINKFITDMLNIDENLIESIDSVDKSDSLDLIVRLKKQNTVCPLCKKPVGINCYKKRVLKHSTLVGRKCNIVYMQRRYICTECEKTFAEHNPFTSESNNMTIETVINVLKDLKLTNETYSSVAKRFSLSVPQVIRIFDKHVSFTRKTLPEVLSIDEHYFPCSSYDSLYMCILMDFRDGTLIDVLPDRRKDYLTSYFSSIKNTTLDEKSHTSELSNVKYISIDLYDNYRDISSIYFPKAVICADSFHVLENLTRIFRTIRLRCRKNCKDENIQYLLSKFRFLFNHDQDLDNEAKYNKRFGRYMNYRQILNLIFERFPELKKAYDIKEEYIYFNSHCSSADAPKEINRMIQLFADSGIDEYVEFYNLLVNWRQEIINSFSIYHGKRINNSYIESRNRQIEKLLFNANGFTNFSRTRNRILYCLNRDSTYKI